MADRLELTRILDVIEETNSISPRSDLNLHYAGQVQATVAQFGRGFNSVDTSVRKLKEEVTEFEVEALNGNAEGMRSELERDGHHVIAVMAKVYPASTDKAFIFRRKQPSKEYAPFILQPLGEAYMPLRENFAKQLENK